MKVNLSEVERRLVDTLTELITQKPYADITIKELVLTAQVSRRCPTFCFRRKHS